MSTVVGPLLKSRRFAPLFVTQFLGAFNDNLLKSGLAIFVTYPSVKGPNVMLGYLRAENPGVLQPPADGWYDTGDLVDIDAEGFITIKGRVKRFAKIAGEMVPLGGVEELANKAYPKSAHAVVALPDPKKGERLVLLTEQADAQRAQLTATAREIGLPEIFVPRVIVPVKSIPLLGTGKIDYVEAARLCSQSDSAQPSYEQAVH